MRILRWILVVLITLYALVGAMPLAQTVLYKAGAFTPTGDMANMQPLMDATSTPVMIVWAGALLLYLASAFLLAARRGRAFPVYVLAFILDLAVPLMTQGPAFDRAFPDKTMLYAAFAVVALVGAGVFLVERGRRGSARAIAA